jgi:hypothetical protein
MKWAEQLLSTPGLLQAAGMARHQPHMGYDASYSIMMGYDASYSIICRAQAAAQRLLQGHINVRQGTRAQGATTKTMPAQ